MTGGYLSSSSERQIDNSSPPPTPVRDASSLKSIRYGPGHEKFPSWPEVALSRSGPVGGGSFRSKSWTDQTHYSKETPAPPTRPYMKRPNPAFTQQLKTVMERCEKIPASTFESRPLPHYPDSRDRDSKVLYLPHLDREGKYLGDDDYSVPSPPERDISGSLTSGPSPLTQADLEEYARTYASDSAQGDYEDYVSCYESESGGSRVYDDPQIGSLHHNHQTQGSYAQSEGYHSYVSSADSTTTTPFLDRLRRDNDCSVLSGMEETAVRRETSRDSSASSGSSSETLKWRGSMSDVSVTSSSRGSSSQLIAHSARVETPQRHLSESVLYLETTSSSGSQLRHSHQIRHQHQLRRLFPVSTYTVAPQPQLNSPTSPKSPPMSVADRISELEKHQPPSSQNAAKSSAKDSGGNGGKDKTSLKAIQKKALLSFYERHHSAWRSEPQLTPLTGQPLSTAQPLTSQLLGQAVTSQSGRPSHGSSRRSSSASDYGGGHWKEMFGSSKDIQHEGSATNGLTKDRGHHHSSSCGSLSTAVLGPIIMGPAISIDDDWVPERPPKKPHLRSGYSAPRPPSPELPPPSPPPNQTEDEVFDPDEPLPPPPPEVAWGHPQPERLKDSSPRNRSPEEGGKQSPPRLPDRQFENSHRPEVFKLRHINEKSSPERERGRISAPGENRSPHHALSLHLDEKLIQDRKSFPTHSYLPELESKSLDYIEPRTKKLSPPPVKSVNKPGPQVPVERKNSLKARNSNIQNQISAHQTPLHPHTTSPKENSVESINKINELRSSYKQAKENFTRSSSVRSSELKIARGSGGFAHHQPDRQSLRFPSSGSPQAASQNGGKLTSSYTSAKVFHNMPLVPKCPTDVVRSLKTASGLPPSLPAQCPPTQHQM
ncbi:protein Shroom-like [Diaphorina citri]|uniref:Protein Shroom-like n=1 Tax=Diaphorina citri TaxID=121845 RepID=A0A3Q0IPS0_DIACI|nr:protein Shroom-like [Diaphorina citri]